MATIVEGNPKAPFSIATTPRCRGGCYSFPVLLYFTLDPYLIMLSVKQGGIKYHFLSLWYDSTWDWTQVSRAISEHCQVHSNLWIYIYIYIYINKMYKNNSKLCVQFVFFQELKCHSLEKKSRFFVCVKSMFDHCRTRMWSVHLWENFPKSQQLQCRFGHSIKSSKRKAICAGPKDLGYQYDACHVTAYRNLIWNPHTFEFLLKF